MPIELHTGDFTGSIDYGKIQMTDADKAFRDGLLQRKAVTPAEAAQNRAEMNSFEGRPKPTLRSIEQPSDA